MEYLYHGVRDVSLIEIIKKEGFSKGFLTTEYDLAWKFAVSNYILKFKRVDFAEGSLKSTQYSFENFNGLQYEYIGREPVPFEIVEAPMP